ncbi:hypothetical protein ACFQX6_52850 [Streptosporangium lutulentum]
MSIRASTAKRDIDSLLNWGAPPSSGPGVDPRETHQPESGTSELLIPAGAPESPHVDAYETSAFGATTGRPDLVASDPDRQPESYVSQLRTVDPSGAETLRGDSVLSLPPTDETATTELNSVSTGDSEPDDTKPDDSEPGEIEGSQPSADSDALDEIYPDDPDGDVTEDPNPPDAQPDTSDPEDTETENPEDPAENENPSDPEGQPEQPEDPADPETPAPDVPDPDVPDPDVPNPDVPDVPNPDVPDVPDPDVPNPDAPDVPNPDVPNPDVPDVPDPDVPNPDVPNPDVPDVPDIPDVPNPDAPDVPVPPQGGGPSDPVGVGEEGPGMPSLPGSPSGGGGIPDPSGGIGSPSQEELDKITKEKAAKEKAAREKAAKVEAARAREQNLSSEGVGGDWRKADPVEMTKLGRDINVIAEEGAAANAHASAKGIKMGNPGFGVMGMMGFTSAYESTHETLVEYLGKARAQLGTWNSQLKKGAEVIKASDDASTIKEA